MAAFAVAILVMVAAAVLAGGTSVLAVFGVGLGVWLDRRRTLGARLPHPPWHFYRIYQGNDIPSLDAFLDVPPDNESSWMASITRIIGQDFTEQKALELAMEREQNLEQTLLETAAKFEDPGVRAVYELNARETHNHYLMIESEYARVMGMVHETDMDTYVRE